jgi:ubiquinone/menaquinone biosynthesis C-methylase UbiE
VAEFREEIRRFYEQYDEAARLSGGVGLIEKARTEELILRRMPAAPARVLDVGGGVGVYAGWLSSLGYEVHLVDAVPRHVEQAAALGLAGARVGDARALDEVDASIDAVLLLGPLYHLTERADRLRALREAHRVLRPGGPVFAAAISRFASLIDGLWTGWYNDASLRPLIEQDLEAGQHRNPTGSIDYFTTAYFHRPEELGPELEAAGLQDVRTYAVEGPGWLAKEPVDVGAALEWIRRVECEPALMGMSFHLLASGIRF